MNNGSPASPQGLIQGFLSRLRFPQLFVVLAMLFAIDLVVPDVVPFIDELFLGLLTALFASWRKRRTEAAPAPPIKNVTPR